MKSHYFFRLDDICPTMNWDNFFALKNIFEKYNIKPILGVIPDNEDKKLMVSSEDHDFWPMIKLLASKNWIIAQHGYKHTYVTDDSGVLMLNRRSEFSGLPYDIQLEKIQKGKDIIEHNIGSSIHWWMAPAHSFDVQTCRALVDAGFTRVTDGIALAPFKKNGLVFLPQQLWRPFLAPFGTWTICLHLNSLSKKDIHELEKFIKKNLSICQTNVNDIKISKPNRFFLIFWYLLFFCKRTVAFICTI